jgi:hypothetical protein
MKSVCERGIAPPSLERHLWGVGLTRTYRQLKGDDNPISRAKHCTTRRGQPTAAIRAINNFPESYTRRAHILLRNFYAHYPPFGPSPDILSLLHTIMYSLDEEAGLHL